MFDRDESNNWAELQSMSYCPVQNINTYKHLKEVKEICCFRLSQILKINLENKR